LTGVVYLNGRFVSEPDARISVYDGGWLHGAGLFETMRAENGCVFRLDSHIERLRRSVAKLLMAIEPEGLPDRNVFAELLERNSLKAARVRLMVTAGSMRGHRTTDNSDFTVCATVADLSPYPADFYEKGVPVIICDFRISPSDPVAAHKTTCYLPRLLGLRQAQQGKCVEALWFTTANRLAEGCISNVIIIKNGVLNTPPLDTPVLPGITRGIVLEIARQIGMEVQECPLTVNDLLDADEVLLTNAIMQVMPVIRIEKHDIHNGRAGPLGKRLLQEYRTRVKEECMSK